MKRCEVGSLSDDPCGDRAGFEVIGWGHGPGREGMQVCPHHAWHALDDGAEVIGPFGHPCTIDEDGEIREVLQ